MSEWSAKRFWTAANVASRDQAFAIELDGRPVRSPSKTELVVPTAALAQAIAAEWDAQAEKIDPLTMPLTRAANAALDKVTPQLIEVAKMLCDYGDTDLLCYRADHPNSLVAEQQKHWDPLLDWATATYDAPLMQIVGMIYQPQPAQSLLQFQNRVARMTPFELTAFHDFVTLSGSLIIGLALFDQHLTVSQAWPIAELDALWQETQWGADDEATQTREKKIAGLETAASLLALLRT